jgi:hypothetical protein
VSDEPIEFEVDEETYDLHSRQRVEVGDIKGGSAYILYMRNPEGSPYAERQLAVLKRVEREKNGGLLVDAHITDPEMKEILVVDMQFNVDGFIYVGDGERVILIGYLWPCIALGIEEQEIKDAISRLLAAEVPQRNLHEDLGAIEDDVREVFSEEGPVDNNRISAAVSAAVTAHLLDDDEVLEEVLNQLSRLELAAFMGGLLANTGNMIGLLAAYWKCERIEAWRTIQRLRHEMGRE